jgi:hypothetical protein
MTRAAFLLVVLLVTPVLIAGESEPVFRSMASVLDMAYEIERYALQHGRLPRASSPAELSQALLGTDSMTEILVDAWGTPLHIDSNPETNHYLIASAGSDRSFDRENWYVPAETSSASADIIVADGKTVRWPERWALARFKAEGGDDATALSAALETSKANRTLADLMLIRMKIEEYATEHGGELPATLPPELPQSDAWGTPFRVTIDRAAKTYRVVAAGADQKFDEKRWSESGETNDFTRDAVLRNGELGPSWQAHGGARELDAAYANFAIFKYKHASLKTLDETERRNLRIEGLRKDMDDAAERQTYFEAMNFYEQYEKLGLRDADRLRSWAYNFTQHTSGPPGQPEPPRLLADARNRAAAGRIAAALRRAIAAATDAERWPLTESLADLERERGEVEVADQLMEEYTRANPKDVRARLRQLGIARTSGDTARMLRLAADVMSIEPGDDKEALYATGVTLYEVVAKSSDELPAERKRAFVAHARRALERAAALAPNEMPPLAYLGLVVRQQAGLEPDPAKAKKLIEEADAIRTRALDVAKRR